MFLVMVLGYILFNKFGMLNDNFVNVCNKFNFTVTLPVMLFRDIASTDIRSEFDWKYVIFCAVVTAIVIILLWIFAKLLVKDRSLVGEFVQASYRSSAAVLGIAYISNIYGNSGMAPLMIIGSVPLFNIFAVVVLTFESGDGSDGDKKEHIRKAFVNVLKNPIIISIFLGVIAALIGVRFPTMIDKTLASVASMASPLALIAIGAGFRFSASVKKIGYVMSASVIKLIVLPMIFIPIAVRFGFTDEKLVALVIMLGSPTTPSSYIMARNISANEDSGVLTSGAVMVTTLLSSFTLTLWLFLLKNNGYII